MVAYSFQKRFVPYITSGLKPHTMRNVRTGRVPHVRPGQAMQLYTAMRTVHCKRIGDAVCAMVTPVTIIFHPKLYPSIDIEGRQSLQGAALESFCKSDGFPGGWLELAAFWHKEHGPDLTRWDGVLIEWVDFKSALTAPAILPVEK